MDPATRAHIEGERRLRESAASALGEIWRQLPSYDRPNIDQWLSLALPVVDAAQRASVALTNAYLAYLLARQPLDLDVEELTGAAVRNGAMPEDVYSRPFVTVWSVLESGTKWEQAVSEGLTRASSAAAMDVQLSMRAAADAIDAVDPNVYGYRRVANPTACKFCLEVDGAYVKAADGFVMALHNECGCGVEPNTEPHEGAVTLPDGTRVRPFQYGPLNDNVAVREHGELGPVLADPKHDFTSSADLALAH